MHRVRQSHVMVIGAGYAGVRAATAAAGQGARVTLVDQTGNHELLTRLAAVAGGRASVGDGWAPVEDLIDVDVEVDVERSQVAEVDTAAPGAVLEDGRILTADSLVVAAGANTRWPQIRGAAEHACGLRTVADALRVRHALVEADHLVIIGGGSTGVQLAAEAARNHGHLEVTVVEALGSLLPELPAAVGRRAEHILRRRGVRVLRRSRAEKVEANGVHIEDGQFLAGRVVAATGYAADGLALLPNARTRDGRLVVDRHLRIPGSVTVFAAGDVAAHIDMFGRPLRMSAQAATQAGAVAGRNAARVARGSESLEKTHLYDLGRVVSMGRTVGVGRVLGVNLAAPVLDRIVPLLHDTIDLRHLFHAGGLRAIREHRPGQHHPDRAAERRVERPQLRSVS